MKIMLVCYGGLSTSILVNNMKKVVNESEKFKNRGIEIEAWGKEEYMHNLTGTEVILLGPQVSIIQDEVKETAYKLGHDVPVLVINKEDYGTMNAVPILKEAFMAIRENKAKVKA